MLSKMMIPGMEQADRYLLAEQMRMKELRANHLTVTAGRPSVLNGLWDLTPMVGNILEKKEEIIQTLSSYMGEQATLVYELMCAEKLYWQNDCYAALIHVLNVIPFLKEKHDMRLLFVALTLEIYILVVNGQATSMERLVEGLKQQLILAEVEEYLPNVDAFEAWSFMYDGDYVKVTKWMREAAPDEYGKFCMLDTFRYMVKMRAYIIQGKYLAVTSLASRLLPLLEAGKRYMDVCELHIIWAMSDYADGRKAEALVHMDQVMELAEKYRYDRLLADEGQRMLELLKFYRKERGQEENNEYLERIIGLADKLAAMHPRYLKTQLPEKPALTDTEMRVLRLLAELKTNAEIAQITGMAEETAKKHCKHIFAKLEVKNRHQAVDKAIELGVIEPKK
jgi:LuxR family maltose regulon positive regulatory protein